ncbi:GNAT family N-acetyltransferase [Micromonospora sp. NBC_01813]|uniref:GNAT family N-acetyltransferase n=1 Tax=Micromonospora sp. NBC_01813 TaxID=2975988 RepID=UPI002DDB138F|nr:GNAT family N-acetyltransferase [Micromonospora sp. NBC_01813]WSA06561.1 GNAT family N-acetyltransferase [Micromonospora sp. NBC_01813]
METPTPTVRRVQPADAARMRALRLEMLADSPLAFLERLADAAARPHHEYAERIARASTGSLLAQFVAEQAAEPAAGPAAGRSGESGRSGSSGRSERRAGGRFVAHAGAHVAADDPATTVLFAIYVSPAWRGQELLAGLIDAVADWSRAAGRPELLLEVVVGNDRAVRAYQRLGFVDTGVRLPHPTLPTLSELQMRRPA